MKTAINTRTQEEYDALMRWRQENGKSYLGSKTWLMYKENTGVDFESNYTLYSNICYYEEIGYTIIPYTEFAANIVEEPDFKALYLEGREVIEQLLSRFNEKQCKDTWDKKAVGYAKFFLTKHNVTPNN